MERGVIWPRFAPAVSTMRSISPRIASAASSRSRGSASAAARRSDLAPVDDGDVGVDVRDVGRDGGEALVQLVLARFQLAHAVQHAACIAAVLDHRDHGLIFGSSSASSERSLAPDARRSPRIGSPASSCSFTTS